MNHNANTNNRKNNNHPLSLSIWFGISILSRLVPHLPNMTPLVSLSVLTSKHFNKLYSCLVICSSCLLGNLILAELYHYPVFGWWSLWQLCGLLLIHYISRYLASKKTFRTPQKIINTFYMTIIYWAWLNSQTWLCSSLYAPSFSGFINAQTMGLPFLRNMMLGDMIFLSLMLGAPYLINSLSQKKYFATR